MTRRLAPVPDAPPRAVGLIRVSKVGDRGDDLTSPGLQRTAITDYAAARGYVVVEWVEALDESASAARSPWWARLDATVGAVERGEIDVILVWRFSRTARNRKRWAIAIDRVEVAGGRLESATEQIDTTTSTGRLARGMLAELAAWESDVKGEVWRETHARRHREGLGHSAYPRLGYRIEGKLHVIDPETAPVAVKAYRRYIAGDGAPSIAEWLNGSGVTQPRSGGRWTPKTLRRFLDSGWAAGLLRVGDSYIEGAHPALIDERTWRAYLRARQRRATVPSRAVTPAHALSGLVRCAGCGAALRVKRLRRWVRGVPTDRVRPPMLVCETFGCQARTYVSAARATEAVLGWLRPLVADKDVSDAMSAADRAAKAVARVDRRSLEREVARIEQRKARLTIDLASGLVLPEDYRTARDTLNTALQEASAALDRTAEMVERPAPSRRVIRRLLDGWDELDEVGRNRALRELVARVDVVTQPEGRSLIRPLGVWESGLEVPVRDP